MSASPEKISELCALMSMDAELTKIAIKVHANKSPQEIQAMIDTMKAFREEVARKLPEATLK